MECAERDRLKEAWKQAEINAVNEDARTKSMTDADPNAFKAQQDVQEQAEQSQRASRRAYFKHIDEHGCGESR